jgi:acyl-coenzyme A thioesterase PaaI-like protein
MADLVTTGPEILTLRWGDVTEESDGEKLREFFPDRRFQEPRGYLHGGIAASAALAAARLMVGSTDDVTSITISLRRPTPLGTDLRVAVSEGDTAHDVRIEHLRDPELEHDSIEETAHATVRYGGYEPAPEIADARQLSIAPIPEPQEHDLLAGCYVCGQGNPEGLQLLPGWYTDDRVITAFVPDERYVEGERKGPISPLVVPALLSCPTLWASRRQMEAAGDDAVLLSDFEVRFHGDLGAPSQARTIGYAGESEGDKYRAASALVDEGGRVYATAYGLWVAVDEMPERDPDHGTPTFDEMPLKGGRPEKFSPDVWGLPLPGRREKPGPRSERVGDG